jgi:multiple sugar transport system ATP-binding protein
MARVEFTNIAKQFGRVTVLEHLNLTVEDGEFLVLLGPSGCGKTTLLNLLAGLLEVSDGSIVIDEREVTDLDPKDRGLAMVFQSYALYPTKTVLGNLKFGLSSQKLSRDEIDRRVQWAAKLLQIEALLNRRPAQLSGGQRQRVAIGRALVKNVGVFLFDEPLSNLDAKLRTEMRLEIKRLHNELKHTIVYVTHDQIEAMTMATRIAVMNSGVIQQIGTPDEIYETPANLFVAQFIGMPAMNMLSATASVSGRKVVAKVAEANSEIDLSGSGLTEMPADGADIVLGLRPEHFSVNAAVMPKDAGQFELPVLYTEKTGSDATAYLKAGERLVAVKVDPADAGKLTVDTMVTASFPAAKINVFDARTGRRM